MELLLPAGNIECFFAAIEGGADAVYLGTKNFNARQRAKNFSYSDIFNIVKYAHSKNVKVFITLNTLIKNTELSELIKTMSILSEIKPDALIIQDLAVANLAKKYFQNIKIHTSTQLAAHNSLDCLFWEKQNFERVILSRELTKSELTKISQKSKIQKEIFVHGALCYSFSGHCLFSSYLGGNSANRGQCTQVCRRNFISENKKFTYFSLKDLQLIEHVPYLNHLNINSLKIEGRMKTPEYVYNVAKAYRNFIDNFSELENSKNILKNDFAREKTEFFWGENLSDSVTNTSGIGILLGKIFNINQTSFQIKTDYKIDKNSKLRLRNSDDNNSEYIKIYGIKSTENGVEILCDTTNFQNNSDLYLVGTTDFKVNNSFENFQNKKFYPPDDKSVAKIINCNSAKGKISDKQQLYLRLSNLDYLNKFNFNDFAFILLKIKEINFNKIFINTIIRKNKSKIIIELPKFISENKLDFYKEFIKQCIDYQLNNFSISNISQIQILPKTANVFSNENIYIINDLAINFVRNNGISEYIYPYENDFPNLISGKDRFGIIPIYYKPELFYSRVPIKTNKIIFDENKNCYNKLIFNGFTIITDSEAVSLTHFINKFQVKGFNKFLIDFSYENDINNLNNVLISIKKSEKIPNTKDFNMKKGLK